MLSMTATIGQSLNKGIMRITGTVLGAIFGLIYFGLFSQDRWLLLVCYSLHLGFCAYMMAGKKNPYFWHITSFVALTVLVNSGGSSKEAFEIAMARLEENATGILVYTLIVVFLWPRDSLDDLKESSRKLLAIQSRLYRTYCNLMTGNISEKIQPLKIEESVLLAKVRETLKEGIIDSNQVFAQQYQWQHFFHLSESLKEAREEWHQNFSRVKSLDLSELIPNLGLFLSRLDLQFKQIECLLNNEVPDQLPSSLNLTIDKDKIQGLSSFQYTTIILIKTELERLQTLSQSLFDCALGFSENDSPVLFPTQKASPIPPTIDPDRLMGAIRMVTLLWTCFFIWIYIDPPGHASFLYLAITFGQASLMSGGNTKGMLLPFTIGTVVTGVVYVFVMPALSGFLELGTLIFIVTFTSHYLFPQPQQTMSRLGSMLPFISLVNLENQQTYDFAAFANGAMMLLLGVIINIAIEYFFTSSRPEKAFLRSLARFHRYCGILLSDLADDKKSSKKSEQRWKADHYYHNLLILPEKLVKYGQHIDYQVFPHNKYEQVDELVMNLQDIVYRIKTLMDTKRYSQDKLPACHLNNDLQDLCLKLGEQFHHWFNNPTVITFEKNLQVNLAEKLDSIETQFREAAILTNQVEYSGDNNSEYFYQLLGIYRGLVEAIIGHALLAEKLDFEQWQEARF
ncbi:fusaric acid resistance family protein [Nitrosomonas sp. PY1]|nr:fusaric acid resistance family protein [Nitrosomonas sp. PY1]